MAGFRDAAPRIRAMSRQRPGIGCVGARPSRRHSCRAGRAGAGALARTSFHAATGGDFGFGSRSYAALAFRMPWPVRSFQAPSIGVAVEFNMSLSASGETTLVAQLPRNAATTPATSAQAAEVPPLAVAASLASTKLLGAQRSGFFFAPSPYAG